MPFTAQELTNMTNAAFDFFLKGPALSQVIQERPLYDLLNKKKKMFPGGRGNIVVNVKGVYTTAIQGYTHDDQVDYRNPANIRQATYPWREIHAGINMTLTELKTDGISVVDTNGENTSQSSDIEVTRITSLLEDKLEDMSEGWARTFTEMLWRDGSQDPKVVPGITGLITDTPTTGIVAGIDRSLNAWWRNRALLGITPSKTNQTLSQTLRSEFRQLRRFGGKPNRILCGSAFLDGLELEVEGKGIYTQQGFVSKGKTDIGLPAISMYGVGDFVYDPALDDIGRSKFAYFIDDSKLTLRPMDGEDMKSHTPARPFNRYVIYRAMTWTGGLVMTQANCHGVYSVV